MAVFVIGAGTTRGAKFAASPSSLCLPPTDADFFTQVQRVQNPKHRQLVQEIMKDTTELFGYNFHVSYETVFSTLEQMIRMVEATRERREFLLADLKARRKRLLQGIAAVFEESMTETRNGKSSLILKSCDYHRRIVEYLKRGDRVIGFNYDCLLDCALRDNGEGKWNPRYGYGFKLGSRGANLTGDKRWQPSIPAVKKDTVHYYKLHGSMHFQIETEVSAGSQNRYQIALKERPYTKQKGTLKFSIIPPESNKRYDTEPYASLWKKAGDAIHQATCIVIIGYSFPPTDLHSSALFRVSVSKGRLASLVVVNPDRDARFRAREILKRGLSPTTRVLVFDTLEEFVKTDRVLWDSRD